MASYVVMQPPGRADSAEAALLIRDRFSWLAFFFPPLWMLWHRLWIEAALAFVALGLLSVLGQKAGFGLAGALLPLLVSLYAGLEANTLRIRALARRGWREWGVVEADRLDDADLRYGLEAETEDPAPQPPRPIVPDAARARPAETGLALGLSHIPGRG